MMLACPECGTRHRKYPSACAIQARSIYDHLIILGPDARKKYGQTELYEVEKTRNDRMAEYLKTQFKDGGELDR